MSRVLSISLNVLKTNSFFSRSRKILRQCIEKLVKSPAQRLPSTMTTALSRLVHCTKLSILGPFPKVLLCFRTNAAELLLAVLSSYCFCASLEMSNTLALQSLSCLMNSSSSLFSSESCPSITTSSFAMITANPSRLPVMLHQFFNFCTARS